MSGLDDELVLNLAKIELEVIAYKLLPAVLEVKEDVLSHIFRR